MIKRYKIFNESNGYYRKDVLIYIRERDLYSLVELLKMKRLMLECIDLILLDIYKFIRRANNIDYSGYKIEQVEELLLILIKSGGDVDQHDIEGYSVLMNSLYISELAVKAVLRRNPDLSYSNIDNLNVFEYVESLREPDTLYKRFYNGLKEVKPDIYREKMREEKRKGFKL